VSRKVEIRVGKAGYDEILTLASAFFAQAELDRRIKS